jgi:hypothetical protein
MYKALYLSPMVPSFNIKGTASFFTGLLEFKIARDDGNYSIVYKNDLTVHILRAGKDIGQMEFYLEVDDVDAVWSSIKDKLDGLKVKAPFNQDYGMREIHIGVPHTNTLLFIGQEIKK